MCELFNDALSNSDYYIAANEGMINQHIFAVKAFVHDDYDR
jgi:hypothetical protein